MESFIVTQKDASKSVLITAETQEDARNFFEKLYGEEAMQTVVNVEHSICIPLNVNDISNEEDAQQAEDKRRYLKAMKAVRDSGAVNMIDGQGVVQCMLEMEFDSTAYYLMNDDGKVNKQRYLTLLEMM